jgi:hypothetical protein
MDKIRKQPGYATSQIRLLLSDLKNTNHGIRSKAVKRFKDYIAVYKPEIFDDDVDYLYTGELDGVQGPGLLYYSSEESKKNAGQLKRISQPVLSLIKYLITCDYDGNTNTCTNSNTCTNTNTNSNTNTCTNSNTSSNTSINTNTNTYTNLILILILIRILILILMLILILIR